MKKNSFYAAHEHFIKNTLFFAGIFLGVFLVTCIILNFLGFIPNEFEVQTQDNTIATQIEQSTFQNLGLTGTSSAEVNSSQIISSPKGETPLRIVAPSINLDADVVHPSSDDYTVLDNSLTHGPVYYPGSGLAGEGNVFIFGHSTGYRIVNNKAYQVFNNIKNLKAGDEIDLFGLKKKYVYKVGDVSLVNATQELVDFSDKKNMLTLSTCNSFGQKTDRYVAEAYLVSIDSI